MLCRGQGPLHRPRGLRRGKRPLQSMHLYAKLCLACKCGRGRERAAAKWGRAMQEGAVLFMLGPLA